MSVKCNNEKIYNCVAKLGKSMTSQAKSHVSQVQLEIFLKHMAKLSKSAASQAKSHGSQVQASHFQAVKVNGNLKSEGKNGCGEREYVSGSEGEGGGCVSVGEWGRKGR
jgi:hypothetical protein